MWTILLVIGLSWTEVTQGNAFDLIEYREPQENVYRRLLSQGVCQVKCLNKSGEAHPPVLDDESELFTKPVSCSSPSCHRCFEAQECEHDGRRCCDANRRILTGNSPSMPLIDDPNFTLRPIFHCSTFIKENSSFDAYFRLQFVQQNNSNFVNLTAQYLPWIFVIALEVTSGQEWISTELFLTPSWLPKVNVPANVTFRLRVSPIASAGGYQPIRSKAITLAPTEDRGIGHRPKNVRVHRIRQNPMVTSHPDLQVLLHWESGMGQAATCTGRIWILDSDAEAYAYNHANTTFWFNLTNQTKGSCLSFGKNYSVHIMEASDMRRDEVSNETELTFKLPPCLQFFNNSFTMCPPPPPRDLRFSVNSKNDILATWLPPQFVSATNKIEAYELRLIKFNPHYSSKSASMPATALHHPTQLLNITVAGSTTSVLFRNVSNSGLIQVIIRAFSKGGVSSVVFEGPHPPLNFSDSVADKFIMAGLVFVFLTFCMAVIVVLKIRKAKRERRRVRAKYFGDDKDIADRLESPYFPTHCSKWLIDTNCLKIGELIGEGNFGQVHAATLYKSQSSRIVAVKTLKEGVNLGEKSKFWEEFQILKNLEPHPNLVRLIGIVKANYPTLVVEYCDGGDLHSFLRNIRDEKLKRLAREKRRLKWMSSGTISGEFLRNSTPNSFTDFDRYTTTAPPIESLNLSVVTNEAYFYSRDRPTPTAMASVSDPVEFNLFVSFGRQIAIGMEFLANNKIVHRDLAARNILVMNESKPILKIADFGLSRDVYEKNWYKKNSDDKIPFKWLALECLLDEVYTTKSDVWSFGILLWEIVTYGGSPYPGIKNVEIFEFLKKGFRMSQPVGCPPELYAVMRKCWERESENRPDFATLRRLLDAMMERSEGVDYFQLSDNQESLSRQSQGSTEGTIEADVKYSILEPLCDVEDDTRVDSHETSKLSQSNPGVTFTENLLYASIMDSNSQDETPSSVSFSEVLMSGLGSNSYVGTNKQNHPSHEPRFSVSLNEMNTKSKQLPFEFEIIRKKDLLISAPENPLCRSDKQMPFLIQKGLNQRNGRYASMTGAVVV